MGKKRLYIFLLLVSLTGCSWLAWNIFEATFHRVTTSLCLFKAITHLPCPSCGTTRSMLLLVNGYIGKSLWINPFGVVLSFALFIIPFWILADILWKSDSFFRRYVSAERLLTQRKWLSVPAIAVVLLNWIWNIIKGV
jgi:hypothetical protein